MIKALESPDEYCRGAAVVAFEELWSKYPEKMEETIPKLMNLLESENMQIQLSIAEVVGIISRKKPEMVVVGKGQQSRVWVPDRIKGFAKGRKVKLFEESSEKAVEIFNAMAATGKRVVAFIHTTC